MPIQPLTDTDLLCLIQNGRAGMTYHTDNRLDITLGAAMEGQERNALLGFLNRSLGLSGDQERQVQQARRFKKTEEVDTVTITDVTPDHIANLTATLNATVSNDNLAETPASTWAAQVKASAGVEPLR